MGEQQCEALRPAIDNSVRILDESAQENLAEYIARPPISLKKIRYEPFKGRVLFHTTYSEYFKENLHMFDALDFIAELTQHIPPKGLQLIRRYGLYASRTKGRWEEMPWCRDRSSAAPAVRPWMFQNALLKGGQNHTRMPLPPIGRNAHRFQRMRSKSILWPISERGPGCRAEQ